MTVALRGVSSRASGSGTTIILTQDVPSLADGDYMVMFIYGNLNAATPPQPPGDWDFIDGETTGNFYVQAWGKIAASEGASYTITRNTGSKSYAAGIVAFYSSGAFELYVDDNANLLTSSSTNRIGPGVTTTKDSAGLVCGFQLSINQASTPPGDMTEQWDELLDAAVRIYAMTSILVAAGATGDKTATGVSSGNTRAVSVAIAELMPPDGTPNTLDAVTFSSTQIDLTWVDTSSNETEFSLERSLDGLTGWTEIATPATDEESYSDTGLTPGITYYYRILARNLDGDSPYSNIDSATTITQDAKVTKFGALLELGSEGVDVTKFGALIEIGSDGIDVTKFGAFVEIGNDTINVTKFGAFLELEFFRPMPTYFPPPIEWNNSHKLLPEPLTGYQLDAGGSYWNVIIPQGNRNLVATPSFQNITNTFLEFFNWAGESRSSEQASRGFHSLKLIPDNGLTGEVRYQFHPDTLGFWNFGLDVYATAGQVLDVTIKSVGGASTFAAAQITVVQTGWTRYNVVYNEKVLTGRNLSLYFRAENTNLAPIYTDGWCVTKGIHENLYFDGDTRENTFSADPYVFAWEGDAHNSYSVRGPRTMSGGYVRSFYDLDFRTTAIMGLGMGDSEPDLVMLADGEEVLRGNQTLGKEFSIIGHIFGNNTYELQRKRQTLLDFLNRLNTANGGVTLLYQAVNGYGAPLGERLLIECAFIGGLSGKMDNHYQEILELRFRLMTGKVVEEFGNVADLDLAQEPDPETGFYAQDPRTGEWETHAFEDNATIGGSVEAILVLDNGDVVVGGSFTAIGGVSAPRIARWSARTGTWGPINVGLAGPVTSLAKGRGIYANHIIIGGQFVENFDEDQTLRRLITYNLTSGVFAEVGSGLNTGTVNTITVHPSGRIFVAGTFTGDNSANTLYGVAFFDARLDGDGAYHNILTEPADGPITKMVVAPDNNLYIGGQFTELNNDINFNAVAYLDLSLVAFPLLAYDNLNKGLNAGVLDMVLGADGYLYAIGTFSADSATGAQVRKFGRWTGNVWEEVGGNYVDGPLWRITGDKRGNLYVTTEPWSDGGDSDAFSETNVYGWNGSSWFPPDIRLHGTVTPGLEAMLVTADGRFFTSAQPASTVNLSSHTVVTNLGSADAPVRLQIIGPCVVHRFSNWTMGKHVYFRGFGLEEGEEFVLDLTTSSPRAYSTTRGDMLSTIIAGASNLTDFRLLPGENHITLLTSGEYDEDTSKAVLSWNNHHWSIDAGLMAHER